MNEQAIASVLSFWFEELTPEQWFKSDPELDKAITVRFGGLHAQAKAGELASWRARGDAAMAEILILDQFSRNIYRDRPQAFECDGLALTAAKRALDNSYDDLAPEPWKLFYYLPFEHSENLADQKMAVAMIGALENENYLQYALDHMRIVERFGRFPHRNKVLGRESTPEEMAFLMEHSGF